MTITLVEYVDATPRVRAVYDDMKATRGFDEIPLFYKALAFDPATLERTWASSKDLYSRTSLDTLIKEMVGIAVCTLLGAEYCTHVHVEYARKLGMTDEMYGELISTITGFSEASVICKTLGLTGEARVE
jgi:AhpD family alkylhydroperoxidase